MIGLILLVFAFVLSLVEAFRGWLQPPPQSWAIPHLGWLGLSLYFLSLLLGAGGIH